MKHLTKKQRKTLKRVLLKFRRNVNHERIGPLFRGKLVPIYLKRIDLMTAHWTEDWNGLHRRWWYEGKQCQSGHRGIPQPKTSAAKSTKQIGAIGQCILRQEQ